MPGYWKVIVVRNEICTLKGILSSPVGINFFPAWKKQKRFQEQIQYRVWFLLQCLVIVCLFVEKKTFTLGSTTSYSQIFIFSSECTIMFSSLSKSASVVLLSLFGLAQDKFAALNLSLPCWVCRGAVEKKCVCPFACLQLGQRLGPEESSDAGSPVLWGAAVRAGFIEDGFQELGVLLSEPTANFQLWR